VQRPQGHVAFTVLRPDVALKALLVLALSVHLHQHFHGPPFDYAALGAASFASWVGVPGPGEPLLIAAGVLAAKHKLNLVEVLLVATGTATLGGIVGWWIGMKAGRRLLVTPGPLHHFRQRALERGDEVFERWAAPAVLLTTSWIAGIHHVRATVYLLWNLIGAVLWAVGIGLGGYFAGPPIVDFVNDLGWVTVLGIVALVSAGVALEVARRHHKRAAGQS
jgi:membrane protein DedA with SNARE-associated domain